jgi:hypothetical protein
MNQADRKEFDMIHGKMDDIKKDIDDLKNSMAVAHDKTDDNLKFIKENMFNPHEGLWAETKLNSQFRENTTKWRSIVGVGFIGLIIDKIWSIFN